MYRETNGSSLLLWNLKIRYNPGWSCVSDSDINWWCCVDTTLTRAIAEFSKLSRWISCCPQSQGRSRALKKLHLPGTNNAMQCNVTEELDGVGWTQTAWCQKRFEVNNWLFFLLFDRVKTRSQDVDVNFPLEDMGLFIHNQWLWVRLLHLLWLFGRLSKMASVNRSWCCCASHRLRRMSSTPASPHMILSWKDPGKPCEEQGGLLQCQR